MEVVFLLSLFVVLGIMGWAPRRDLKKQQAAALLALMFAEDEQEWADLKAAAADCGLTIDEADDRLWRGGYFLMPAEDRKQFKLVAAQLIHGVKIPGMTESAHSLFAYLRSHGLRPRDCRPYFVSLGMPDIRSLPSEAEIRRQSLRD